MSYEFPQHVRAGTICHLLPRVCSVIWRHPISTRPNILKMENSVVKLSVPTSEDVIKLSILDQQIMRFYAKIVNIFKLDTANNLDDVVHHLKEGLGVALSEIPDFAATLVPVPGSQRKEIELHIGPESGVQFRWTHGLVIQKSPSHRLYSGAASLHARNSLAWQLEQAYPGGTSLFTTRLDFRARTKPPFPDTFVGNINKPTARVRLPLAEVCAASTPESLVTLAEAIRVATEGTGEQAMRTLIGLVNNAAAVTDVAWNYNYFPEPDLGVTDISGIEALKQNWGTPLGTPTHIKSYSRETGLLYLFPQDQDGGFEIQIQCENEAVEALKRDDRFQQYCEFRQISHHNESAGNAPP
ncbi:hypothetical protein P175DRAFT_0522838 [Aspergillus ochraceoroseus IBT 24754]|uniref:Uncharacterized protein n=1 Tax=Aspergillus ochraceoroseus IBT 24754 TaxID=1392256 RepID=A0A2T5LZ86_9EURO|nr:uncharacterized protein P175DRAFT_0522838 [Aspergillus ochraceoroseus IBT 24754]PTU21582.1 hypothetical protein P175DRAFT_0522838 [Aspergillus ochraceoroseus IBT 24754]